MDVRSFLDPLQFLDAGLVLIEKQKIYSTEIQMVAKIKMNKYFTSNKTAKHFKWKLKS